MLSIQSLARGLRPASNPPRLDDSLLDIYLILYDLLNDDDEEIREIAALTASWVLSYSSVSPQTAVNLGALDSSSLLATFIISHYAHSADLCGRVIRYITGQECRISGSNGQMRLKSVADLISEYSQESTVLFAEEKQNLFIDEVREVDVWSKALLAFQKNAYPEALIRQFSSWVLDGLRHLSLLLTEGPGLDGYLGWTSKPECFTLGTRLISISCAMISETFSASNIMEFEVAVLQKQLQDLREAGQRAFLHEEWLTRIDQGLR